MKYSAAIGGSSPSIAAPSFEEGDAILGNDRPNVLMILCDQLNAGVLGCYGGPVPAPNLARLAGEGVIFDNATCTSPVCTPARASIVTGKYPHSHGIVGNVWRNEYPWFKGVPPTEEGIGPDDLTTENLLNRQGYSTDHFGKWHLNGDNKLPYYPVMYREHFEYANEMAETFSAVRAQPPEQWLDWYGWALPVRVPDGVREAVRRFELSGADIAVHPFTKKIGLLEMDFRDTYDSRVVDRTVQCLRSSRDRPFMITCSLNTPHDPNVLPRPFYGMFRPEQIELPASFGRREDRFEPDLSRNIVKAYGEGYVREFLAIYYSSVMMLDHFVGRILDALDEEGLVENTIVVFTSDHGDMAGGHGMVWKNTLAFYEEITRQTLLLRYPAGLRAGRCAAVTSAVDILPTLLDLCGVAAPGDIDGTSLLPLLTGGPPQGDRYVRCERIDWNEGHTRSGAAGAAASVMLRGREWKYIRYHDGQEYLYNLKDDPGEMVNLCGGPAHEDKRRELERELKTINLNL